MIQTLALVIDAYRELSAKKLFWLVLILSGIVVVSFALLGIDKQGISMGPWSLGSFGGFVNSDNIPPDRFYKALFSGFGVKFWLAWLASILALVSTASIFPDFIAGGAIELTLSKPISRLRLFLTKYFTGLLFVALQVSVFSTACFLVIGIRGKTWQPSIFLAIPLVVVFFSYLFSMCALLGLLTRSTIASLLLTLLFWTFLFCLNLSDGLVIQGRELNLMQGETIVKQVERMERSAAEQLRRDAISSAVSMGTPHDKAEADAKAMTFTPEQLAAENSKITDSRNDLETTKRHAPYWARGASAMHLAKSFFPKTDETTELLERSLVKEMDLDVPDDEERTDTPSWARLSRADQQRLAQRIQAAYRQRSAWWVLGTSLGFEALVLAIASWVFVRRDF